MVTHDYQTLVWDHIVRFINVESLFYDILTMYFKGWATVYSWSMKSFYSRIGSELCYRCKRSGPFGLPHETLSRSEWLFDFPNFKIIGVFQFWSPYKTPVTVGGIPWHLNWNITILAWSTWFRNANLPMPSMKRHCFFVFFFLSI